MLIKMATVRDVEFPSRGHATDAGMDFFCPKFDESFVDNINDNKVNDKFSWQADPKKGNSLIIMPGGSVVIPSGIKAEIPYGHMGLFLNKSGVATKHKLMIGAQVVDTFYSGEIHVDLHNIGDRPVFIQPGMKLAQMVIVPAIAAEPTDCAEEDLYYDMKKGSFRDEGGFGSTDKKKA